MFDERQSLFARQKLQIIDELGYLRSRRGGGFHAVL
jgi:hypothetical protein